MALGTLGLGVIGEKEAVDGKSTGATLIVSAADIPSGSHLSPVMLTFETISSDSITETAIVSVGTNASNYDNVYPAHGIDIVEGKIETIILPSSMLIDAETDIYVRVIRAATGTELTFVVGFGCLSYAAA